MKSIPADFKLSASIASGSNCKTIEKLITCLESSAFKELFGTRELAARAGLKSRTISGHSADPALAENKVRFTGSPNLYGSKKTIRELKKRLKENAA